ncbi:hypothetical protein CMZ84_03775 [Lysobacteraceae bacterium NML93-0399]|nr:hypothetical protein CMZ84_03775 [Xanthomonadaceae bacterium NML93-0399]
MSLLLFVTACGKNEQDAAHQAQDANGVEASPGAQEQEDVPELAALKTELLAGQGGHLRYDRIQKNDGGEERQIYIEMMGASAAEAAGRSLDILKTQGFILDSKSEGNDEDIRASLQKSGRSVVKLRVRGRAVHANLMRQDATSSVYVTYAL